MKDKIGGQIKELQDSAARILEMKKATRPRRPIVLEFGGTPKSGKTSCLSSLNLFLKRNGFATKLLTERASICPISDKFNPLFNIWTCNSAVAELAATFAEQGKTLDVIICDRGVFDALCWFEWLLEHDHMKEEDHRAVVNYLTTDRLRSMIDLVYLFKATPKVAMGREYAHLLTTKRGSIMNTKVLEEYNKCAQNVADKYGTQFRCVRRIDTSKLDQNDVSYQVTKDVLETLYVLIVEKVGYFQRPDLERFETRTFWDFSEFDPVPRLRYGPRDELENDTSAIQPVPVLVITNRGRDKVLVVKKKARSMRNRSPERDKLLAYVGGHIRAEDNLHGPHEDVKSIASTALSREVQEELSLSLSITDANPLCVWVKNSARSTVHLALVYVYEADFDHLSFKLDEFEFIQTTGRSKSGRVASVADLWGGEMEEWSRIILTQKVGADLHQQLFFDTVSWEGGFPTTGEKPGEGTYRCQRCGQRLTLDDQADTLPPCATCNGTEFVKEP